jgi:deazaflavin-dependent oxidoreductase (nitroreductase family)
MAKGRWKVFNQFTRLNTAVYRMSGGRLLGSFRGAPVLLLNHVGRKSGKRRTTPLMYIEDGERLVIVASKGGSHKHPIWWLNLRAAPKTTVEVGREKRSVTARQASSDEKARMWPRLVEMWPDYDRYQGRTERDIPVIVLEPSTSSRL